MWRVYKVHVLITGVFIENLAQEPDGLIRRPGQNYPHDIL